MKRYGLRYGYHLCAILLVLLFTCFLGPGCREELIYDVPDSGRTTKPWTRWWWMGSSLTEEGITQHLEAFKNAGLGGVEIVPIYGEKGDEENFIFYLSDRWIEMLLYTLREADRLDLGVDMTLGSGWPYGGPWIKEEHAARRYSESSDKGELTGQMVKRAAPGAGGLVVDHFNTVAMQSFLMRFDSLMQVIRRDELPLRAIFNDSYEVYGADWTAAFCDIFQEKRGYPFPLNLFNAEDTLDPETLSFWQDYHTTIGELLYETAGEKIGAWCGNNGLQYRYQAHGSPSNLLDLYGLASIPETECFGSSKFSIPHVPYDTSYDEERFGRPHPLIYKFASSPANILGKPLVSSETGTWLADHFKVSLSQVKPQVDELLVSGINHIFYHGIAYSPFDKPFPGRLFYASTNFGPSSALWSHLASLNDYIKNCQTILQNAASDNDLLLYYPVYDLWNNKGNDGNLIVQGVHNTKSWLFNTPFGKTALELYEAGFAFDYVSDRQLEFLASGSVISSKPYRAVIIPPTTHMPAETARNLGVLQQKGVPVYFLESFPDKTPGYHDRQQHSAQLKEYIQSGAFKDPIPDNKDTLSDVLADSRIYPESIKQEGMSFIRKSHKDGYLYFISNLSDYNIDGHYSFARKFRAAEILNPLTGMRGKAGTREDHAGTVVRLQLEPGQSVFLITYDHNIKQADWHYIGKQYKPVDLNRPWKISFENKLDEYELDSLRSWTELPFSWAPYYSGKAIYTITFDFDTTRIHTDALMLDLGDLRYMATAWLNHEKIGDFWCVPFQVMISPDLLKPVNTLVLEVQNLDANRIIQIDRERIPWKDFYDINFVDIGYQPFDASSWTPLPSGLLGPVRLIPVSF